MKIKHSVVSVLLGCLMISQTAVAQDDALHSAAAESVTLKVGDIFEILPVHDLPTESSYTWILTQDRTFLEATRAPMFRKRFIQPGTYTLFADIVSPDGSRRITRTFTINYQARQPGEPITQTGTTDGEKLVTTVPELDAMGRTALPADTQLIRLNPVNPDITPLALDLDLNRDADGDGSNDNDIQANDTFFASDATPLYLWIADETLTRHPISVTASLPDGARVQKIEILEESLARSEGVVQGPVMISAEKTAGRMYQFTAVFDGATPAGGQLLYQWQFGDGKQSLVNSPSHEYADDGDYTVQLLIRNLRDGKEMANTSTTVSVLGTDVAPSSEPQQHSSEDTEEPTNNGNSAFDLRSILLLGGIFIGSLIIGAIIMTLLSFLRRNKGSMAQKIEALEQAVVKPIDSTPALNIAPPTPSPKPAEPAVAATEPKLQTPPAEIAKREEQRATSNPVMQPSQTVNAKAAPAWLQQPAPKPAAPASVPTPKPTQATQTSKPVTPPAAQPPKQPIPAPQPQPAAQQPQTPRQPTPAPQPNRPATPAWLQQPAPVTPAPHSQPKPAQPVVPPAPQTPKPQPIPPPAPTPARVQPPMPASTVPATADSPMPTPIEPIAPMNVPSTPAPVVPPKPMQPIQQPIASTPAAPTAPTPPENTPKPQDQVLPADQPIAIIRAESLNPENQQNQ